MAKTKLTLNVQEDLIQAIKIQAILEKTILSTCRRYLQLGL